jgi:hypothetical protein
MLVTPKNVDEKMLAPLLEMLTKNVGNTSKNVDENGCKHSREMLTKKLMQHSRKMLTKKCWQRKMLMKKYRQHFQKIIEKIKINRVWKLGKLNCFKWAVFGPTWAL